MWYHWILVVAGVYLVGSAVYSIILNRSMTNVIMSGIQIAVGAGIGYYGYTSAMTPVVPSFVPAPVASAASTMMGGMRKMFRK
jgi:multisubunit Na+/H+ antiporter MnhC subunit